MEHAFMLIPYPYAYRTNDIVYDRTQKVLVYSVPLRRVGEQSRAHIRYAHSVSG